jgi:hypothetical protein
MEYINPNREPKAWLDNIMKKREKEFFLQTYGDGRTAVTSMDGPRARGNLING